VARLHRIRRIQHEDEVPLHDHLDELRNRLIVSVLALVAGFVVAFWRRDDIIELLNRKLPDDVGTPITLAVTEPLKIAIIISLWSALIVALPVLFYQLYAFVVPAFSEDAQRHIWPLLVIVPLLFLAGVVFAYVFMLEISTEFLLGFDKENYQVEVRARDYYSYAVMLCAGMGLVFEMPAAVWMLSRLGVVSSRLLRRSRRYAIFILAVIAAALPGGDPISMMLGMIPLLLLYEASIVVARLVERRRDAVGDAVGDT
jgi:sec-independent protein translocase protein TatC